MQPFSCQHREQHIFKIQIRIAQEIHISRLKLQRWSSEFVLFPFHKYIFGICEWGLANFFKDQDHVIQISIRQLNFQYIFLFSQLWILKTFCGYIYSLQSNTYFRGINRYVCPIGIFIFYRYWPGPNLQCTHPSFSRLLSYLLFSSVSFLSCPVFSNCPSISIIRCPLLPVCNNSNMLHFSLFSCLFH